MCFLPHLLMCGKNFPGEIFLPGPDRCSLVDFSPGILGWFLACESGFVLEGGAELEESLLVLWWGGFL